MLRQQLAPDLHVAILDGRQLLIDVALVLVRLGARQDAAARRVSWVEITTSGGQVHRGPERIAPGHWELGGMPWDDLGEKFASLVDPRLGPEATERILTFVRDLEKHDDLAELSAAVTAHR